VVNGHLEDSLRREIESYLENRLDAVRQEITTLQSLLNESLSNRVPSFYDPSHSRGQEGGGSTKRLAPSASASHGPGAPLGVRRLFSAEDANSPWCFSHLEEPSPNHADL
jgi:hypothetical protein